MTPLLVLIFRFVLPERAGTIVLSTFVAHTGWHWFLDRGEQLRQFRFEWPALATVANSLRWLVLVLVVAGLFRYVVRRWATLAPSQDSVVGVDTSQAQPETD
jgi:hypothetical protein